MHKQFKCKQANVLKGLKEEIFVKALNINYSESVYCSFLFGQ